MYTSLCVQIQMLLELRHLDVLPLQLRQTLAHTSPHVHKHTHTHCIFMQKHHLLIFDQSEIEINDEPTWTDFEPGLLIRFILGLIV